MDSSPDLPAVTKHPHFAALRRWGDVTSLAGILPALLPSHNLLGVTPRKRIAQALGGHTQQELAELRGTP